jgi:hypothetical protein
MIYNRHIWLVQRTHFQRLGHCLLCGIQLNKYSNNIHNLRYYTLLFLTHFTPLIVITHILCLLSYDILIRLLVYAIMLYIFQFFAVMLISNSNLLYDLQNRLFQFMISIYDFLKAQHQTSD